MSADPHFCMSADARLLYRRLREVAVGDSVSYAAMSVLTGRAIDGSSHALRSALRQLLSDDQMVFAAVRGEGFKRLSDAEIVANGGHDVDRLGRLSRRSIRKITAIADFTALSPHQQIEHTARLSVMTLVGAATTDGAMRRIETAAQGRTVALPFAETLAAFAGSEGKNR